MQQEGEHMLKRIRTWWEGVIEEFKELLLKSGMEAEAEAEGHKWDE